MTAHYAKTEQIISTVTARDLARLDAYADACPQSRAGAIRDFVLSGLTRWEREQGLVFVDVDQLAEGENSSQSG